MKKKALISSILTIAICVSLIAGATFALFTSESRVNISVSAGNVKVVATADGLKTYSMNEEWDEVKGTTGEAYFQNGGFASIQDANVISLKNITPGDSVSFNVHIENQSTVNVQYRTLVDCVKDTGLLNGLVITFEKEAADGTKTTETFQNFAYENWTSLTYTGNAGDTAEEGVKETVANVKVTITLPEEAGNEYQGKEAELYYIVEAVQGNAKEVTYNGLKLDESGAALITDETDLKIFASMVNKATGAGTKLNADALATVLSTAENFPSVNYIDTPTQFKGMTVKLTKDIDLNGKPFFGIGTEESPFLGTFDGQDHTISNFTQTKHTGAGLFGVAGEGSNKACIDNVNVDKATINGCHLAGAVVGKIWGDVTNCDVTNSKVYANPNLDAASCYDGDKAGGIVGHAFNGLVAGNTVENVTVKAFRDLGAIVGCLSNDGAQVIVYAEKNTVKEGCVVEFVIAQRDPDGHVNQNIGAILGRKAGDGSPVEEVDNTVNGLTIVDEKGVATTYVASEKTLAAAIANGGNIEVTSDVTASATLVIPKDAEVKLSLNDNTLSAAVPKTVGHVLKNEGTLTIKGGAIVSTADNGGSAIYNATTGTLYVEGTELQGAPKAGSSWPSYAINNYGDMTVSNVKITSNHGAISSGSGSMTLNNVNVTMNGIGGSSHVFYVGDSKVVVNGGTYIHGGNSDGSLAYVMSGSTFIVNGGTFSASNGGYGLAAYKGDIIINGGTFNNAFLDWSGRIDIFGGTFKTEPTTKDNISVFGKVTKNAENMYEVDSTGYYVEIGTAAELAALNANWANGAPAFVRLTADIDFSGYTWKTVDAHADNATKLFKVLDGNGHTISNMTIDGQAMFWRFATGNGVTIRDITFDNVTVDADAINTSVLCVQVYTNTLLDNVKVINSSISGNYKVAPLVGSVYDEWSDRTATLTVKDCVVENCQVTAKTYDFCTTGMVAYVAASNNDKIEFVGNNKISNVTLNVPMDDYEAHANVYTTGSESLYDTAENVTVENVTVNVRFDDFDQGADGVYYISSVNGLFQFAANVNNGTTYKAETVKLIADIDLDGYNWTPIGLTGDVAGFQGTFDGQGHTISNLTVDLDDTPAYQSAGLFGSARDGVIKNFTIENANISNITTGNANGATSCGTAVVVGSAQFALTIDNVDVINATVNGNRYVGAIAGYFQGTITNCDVTDVDLVATPDNCGGSFDNGDKIGGIIGYANVSVTLKNNTVTDATIKGYRDIGGIVGAVTFNVDTDKDNVLDTRIATIENNKVTNVTIIVDQFTNSYGPKDANADAIVGRKLGWLETDSISSSNSATNVNIVVAVYTAEDLTKAIANAKAGETTYIVFMKDIEGEATAVQKLNANVVIDGANHTFNGKIYINGRSDATAETLTIRNIKFVTDDNSLGAFIDAYYGTTNQTRYAHNVTIEDCFFTMLEDAKYVVGAIDLYQPYNILVQRCTVTGAHSVLQNKGGHDGITIDTVTATDCKNGISVGTHDGLVTIKNCTIESVNPYGYGIRADASGAYQMILESCNITADAPILLRKASGAYTMTYDDKCVFTINTTANNDDKIIITASDFEEGTELTAPTNIIKINGVAYVGTSESLNNALSNGETKIYLLDGEYEVDNGQNKTVTISGSKKAIIRVEKEDAYEGNDYGFDGATVTFNGITIDTTAQNGTYRSFARMTAVYHDCHIEGVYTLGTGTSKFYNCTFDTNNNYVWTWGASEVVFEECTFDSEVGKAILVYGGTSATVTVQDCTFKAAKAGYTNYEPKQYVSAVEIDNSMGSTYTVNIKGTNSVIFTGTEADEKGNTGFNSYTQANNQLYRFKTAAVADRITVHVEA